MFQQRFKVLPNELFDMGKLDDSLVIVGLEYVFYQSRYDDAFARARRHGHNGVAHVLAEVIPYGINTLRLIPAKVHLMPAHVGATFPGAGIRKSAYNLPEYRSNL